MFLLGALVMMTTAYVVSAMRPGPTIAAVDSQTLAGSTPTLTAAQKQQVTDIADRDATLRALLQGRGTSTKSLVAWTTERGTLLGGVITLSLDTPATLSVNGTTLFADPSTPPVHTYTASIDLTAGVQYTIQINGDTSALTWAMPSDLAPGISDAVAAAKSASSAVVVVSDDTESEAADRPGLNLPSAQNELISAVAAANPHTVVVINAGAPVSMPWLAQVGAVLDAWYPGQSNGTSLARVLFGDVDPSGHLPVTFPASLNISLTDGTNANVYPITGTSYALVYENQTSKATAAALVKKALRRPEWLPCVVQEIIRIL